MNTVSINISNIPSDWNENQLKQTLSLYGFDTILVKIHSTQIPGAANNSKSALCIFKSLQETQNILDVLIPVDDEEIEFLQFEAPVSPKTIAAPPLISKKIPFDHGHPIQQQQHQHQHQHQHQQQQQHQQKQPHQSHQHQQYSRKTHNSCKFPNQKFSSQNATNTNTTSNIKNLHWTSHSSPNPGTFPSNSKSRSKITSCILIGETGSGKSTLLNTLANFFTQGTVDSPTIAIPTQYFPIVNYGSNTHSESNVRNQAQSQTSKCTKYEFQKDDLTLHLYDTPGLNDTNGANQDDKNLDLISDAVRSAINVAAVILVLNGSASRFTLTCQNLFHRLSTTLPDSILNNVLITFTNVQAHSCNFPMEQLYNFFDFAHIFYFNNSAFSKNPQNRRSGELKALREEWKTSMKSCKMLIDAISQFGAVSTKDFETMRQIRQCIKSRLHDSQVAMGNLQTVLDQIEKAEKASKLAQDDQVAYSNYTQTTFIQQGTWIASSFHSTICSTCDDVCHYCCDLPEQTVQGSDKLLGCEIFTFDDNCNICKGREKICDHTSHYHALKIKQQVDQTVESTLNDIKIKYDTAIQALHLSEKNLTNAQEQRAMVNAGMQQVVLDVENECAKLKKLCRNFNLAQELNILIENLRVSKNTLKTVGAQQQAQLVINNLTQMIDRVNKAPVNTTSTKAKDGSGFQIFNPCDDESSEEEDNGIQNDNFSRNCKSRGKEQNNRHKSTKYDYATQNAARQAYLNDTIHKYSTEGTQTAAAAASESSSIQKKKKKQKKQQINQNGEQNQQNQQAQQHFEPFLNNNTYTNVTFNLNVKIVVNDDAASENFSSPQFMNFAQNQSLLVNFEPIIPIKQYTVLETHTASYGGELTVFKGHHLMVLSKSSKYLQVYNATNRQCGFIPNDLDIQPLCSPQLTFDSERTNSSNKYQYALVNASKQISSPPQSSFYVESARLVYSTGFQQLGGSLPTRVYILGNSDASSVIIYEPLSKQVIEICSTNLALDRSNK